MRKYVITAIILLAAAISAVAQGRVETRSYILEDFQDNVTKVVVPQDVILGSAFKQEVVNNWNASAFEFCTQEEFETLKANDSYYFLIVTANRFKGEPEPGILFLSLLKGGKGADKGVSGLHEVVSLPIAPTDDRSGRELIYIGAMVKSIQEYTLAAMESEKTAYAPDKWFNSNYAKWGRMMTIKLASEDLSLSVKDSDLEKYLDADFGVCSADDADEAFAEAPVNTLVSYCVAPIDPSASSYSYQMLFKADTMELYYISRHKIRPRSMAGFISSDLKWLRARR